MSHGRNLLLTFLLLCCSSLAVASASEAQPFGIVQFPSNITHLDSGVARHNDPFFPSRASTAGRKITPAHFDQPQVCGGCHTEIYAQWNGSMHSRAWDDPVYRAALNYISKASGGKADNFCMGCHTPIGVVTGTASPSGEGMSEAANDGVQCEVCHNISGSSGIGNGAYVLTPRLNGRPLKFGPFNDAVSPYHDTSYSELHTRSEFCGQCHDVTHPFNRVPLERTYSEWRDSSYAGKGIQCQDCHMKPAPGTATPFSKKREKIYSHYFVGGNALVTRMLGSPVHAEMAEAMLRSAAKVEFVSTAPLTRGAVNVVRVRVENIGAGHKLPTGFPEGREMWLDLKVVDARGAEIYRLGAVKNGVTEKGTKSFKVVLGDRHGHEVHTNILEADRILYDTRLEPSGSREVEYMVKLPKEVSGPVTLRADLNYWSFSQALLDQLMGEQAPRAHITEMASASISASLQ